MSHLSLAEKATDKAEPLVKSTITVAFPIDTIANARTALERLVIVANGILVALDAGVVEYGDAEVLRGIGQLLSALGHSVVKNWWYLLAIPVLHGHAWFGKACLLHSLSGIL